jgi:predicted P-loop ATPase
MNEIWKAIPTYEGFYEVSNIGNVRSLDRIVYPNGIGRLEKGICIKQRLDEKGYPKVYLSKNGVSKKIRVHQLVAMAFLGHVRDGSMKVLVDHINDIKNDNRVENLQFLNNRENVTKSLDRNKCSSKYIGVYWDKSRNKWTSGIKINGIKKHLGRFQNEYDAHLAYQKALEEIKKAT